MDRRQALRFVRRHGVVLEAARGAEPSLAARIAGEALTGSWWGHPAGHAIYAVLQALRDSDAVLVCTLAGGRITYVHRHLWPAFVKLAQRFPAGALDQVREEHTPAGTHRRQVVPFPTWVPAPVLAAARSLSTSEARALIRVWLDRYGAR